MSSTPHRARGPSLPSDARAVFEELLPARLAAAGRVLPDGVGVHFHVEGGGDWLVRGAGGRVLVGAPLNRPSDCRVSCSAGLLLDLVAGVLDPRQAFRAGRLRVQGDVGLALRLAELLREPR
jgi:ubiquinone biosynthesis protein UbiJ